KFDTTANGLTTPFSITTDTAHLTVSDVNDAPTLTPTNPTLTPITEDQAANSGQLVSSFAIAGTNINDVDPGAVQAIAITGLTSTNGTWQYSINGGSTWTNIGSVSTTQALLLRAADLIRFVPDGLNGGVDSITS